MGSLAALPVSQPGLCSHRERESSCAANRSLLAGGKLPVWQRGTGDGRIRHGPSKWGLRASSRCLCSGAGIQGHPELFLGLPESLVWRGQALGAGLGVPCSDWVLPPLAFPCPCFRVVAERQELSPGEGPQALGRSPICSS